MSDLITLPADLMHLRELPQVREPMVTAEHLRDDPEPSPLPEPEAAQRYEVPRIIKLFAVAVVIVAIAACVAIVASDRTTSRLLDIRGMA